MALWNFNSSYYKLTLSNTNILTSSHQITIIKTTLAHAWLPHLDPSYVYQPDQSGLTSQMPGVASQITGLQAQYQTVSSQIPGMQTQIPQVPQMASQMAAGVPQAYLSPATQPPLSAPLPANPMPKPAPQPAHLASSMLTNGAASLGLYGMPGGLSGSSATAATRQPSNIPINAYNVEYFGNNKQVFV